MKTPSGLSPMHIVGNDDADDPRNAKLALIDGRLVYNPGSDVARLPRWLQWLQGRRS